MKASRILGIALTTRDKGRENPVPMCGVPFHSATSYISRLLAAGHKVAVCEQAPQDQGARGLMRREVVRIITPGTVLEDEHLDGERANYLMALWEDDNGGAAGIAFVDVSTGDFRATRVFTRSQLVSEINRVNPREIVSSGGDVPCGPCPVTRVQDVMTQERAERVLNDHFGTVTVDGFGLKEAPEAVIAAAVALEYVRQTCKEGLAHISRLRFYNPHSFMMLGATTVRNLELFETITGTRGNTLFSILNQTRTPMGARMLADWMSFPLLDPATIDERLDAVDELVTSGDLLGALREALSGMPDMERITGRIAAASAGPRDMRALADGLSRVPHVVTLLEGVRSDLLKTTAGGIDAMEELTDRIRRTLVEAPPPRLGDAPCVADGVDGELDELRAMRRDSRQWISSMEARERELSGIANLKIGYNKVFGYYIEISKAQAARAPAHFIRKQTLVNAERFITPELKEYEARLLNAEAAIASIERRIVGELRDAILPHVEAVQKTVRMLARLDVLAALAVAAGKYGYTRPTVTDDRRIEI
ncbi:MAG TPA: DNA mismatch repair protein MutS, partial [Deltaproteobacteria bacterium]|nr:DNA mismatch repair protein MutS [Deltaproteobacteria bacterium]